MRLAILAVGRMKAGPERELYDRYHQRISRSGGNLHLQGPDLVETAESRARDAIARRNAEAESLIASTGNAPRIILLDENGKDLDSRAFAALIREEQDAGTDTLSFALGGPDGHGDALRAKSFRKLRFGSFTWPHQMARIMLAEQIYRAITILSGHPYHRD
ncbi:MAG: 23S rRNA (pseudouridine(1915)-N(3))-methyltransferase RlmH [Rhizobiaceae bacterium]|nr:23S rRNA (pseudouridine(1915)-N(3))-methyltransferase RlmH [Rhizobiaceae bacterium]